MSKEKRVASRPVRKRLSRKGRMYSIARPGFKQRWANDEMGNIEELMDAGYTPRVKEKSGSVLDKEREGTAQGTGTFANAITKVVNRDGLVAILMEIPEEIFLERKLEKQQEVNALEAHLQPGSQDGTYGSMSLEASSGKKGK